MSFLKKRPYILFVLPAFLIYTMFAVYPIFTTIPYSFMKWGGVGAAQFVGFDNFMKIFGNGELASQMLNALKNNFFMLFLTYVIVNPIVIILAYLLYKNIWGSSIYKTVIFMPQFVNAVAVTFIVTLFFSPDIGLYSNIMNLLGLGKWSIPALWQEPSYGVPLVLLVTCWRGIGYEMLLYIANFNMIPAELDQAAKIDGAGEVKRFIHIYFPLLAPTFTNVVVLMYIWTLTTFDVPYLLGGITGGVGGNMDTIQLFFYRTVFGRGSYSTNFLGIGSSISSVILVILVSGSLFLQSFLRKRQVEY